MTRWISRFFWLLMMLAFVAPYMISVSTWWTFFPATCLIVLFQYFRCPKDWLETLGLNFRCADRGKFGLMRPVLWSFFLFVVAAWVFRIFLFAIAARQGLVSGSNSVPASWRLFNIAQALNEEMVLRALLLTYLLKASSAFLVSGRWFRSGRELGMMAIVVSVCCAGLFAGAHFVLYRYGFGEGILNVRALTTLFFFGLAANDLYIRFGHIGFSFALHAAWNLSRFGEQWLLDGQWLGEANGFNLIEGNVYTLVGAVTVWALTRIICLKTSAGNLDPYL